MAMYSSGECNRLLQGLRLHFFGDSNIRAIYKDVLWLLEDGRLIPEMTLKKKNEESHANDYRISDGTLHNGCDYDERREYRGNVTVKFHFITRLNRSSFIETVKNFNEDPHYIIINSCLWDLTRWGTDGVEQYKNNIFETFKFLKTYVPKTRVVWVTSLPPSFRCRGGFLTKEIEFMRNMLPWHIVYANKYAEDTARFFSMDILDLHYHFRFLMNHHAPDGIHWDSLAVRYATNLVLRHISLTLETLQTSNIVRSRYKNNCKRKNRVPLKAIENNQYQFSKLKRFGQ